ncbi:MAG: methyltransferase domain-containing protein [Methanocalculaceae archaeon]|jgi:SAM-dependent methyltransferase|nr:methyltransferase domain-containing protein [Methanocalculaceae archaeon]
MRDTHEESLQAWEGNADYWDARMGDHSNTFHRLLVRPPTEKLLGIQPGDFVLDIACGNGNFTQRLVELGARVVAFDYSGKMIENARRRRAGVLDKTEFVVCDATDSDWYLSSCVYKGEALLGQPVLHNYYHRSLQEILGTAFAVGFVLDAFVETADNDPEFPVIVTMRLKKLA